MLPSSTGNPVPQPRALLQSISQFCLSAGLEVIACTVKTQYFAVSSVSKTPQPGSMPLALDCEELRILISHASVDTFKYPPIGSRDERQLTLCTRHDSALGVAAEAEKPLAQRVVQHEKNVGRVNKYRSPTVGG